MDVDKALKQRKSVRQFLDKKVSKQDIEKIINAGILAPSACNEQLWRFVVVQRMPVKEKLVRAGTSRLLLGAPVAVAVYYHDKNHDLALQSASAAIQNMLLKATALDIGSLWMASVGNRKKISEILQVPREFYLVSFVLLGYAKNPELPKTGRKDLGKVLSYDAFKGESVKLVHDPDKWSLDEIREYQRHYCGKTDPGTGMGVVNKKELDKIKSVVERYASKNSKVLDLFTYDGSYFIGSADVNCLDLTKETSDYSKAALKKGKFYVLNKDFPFKDEEFDVVNITFKLESIPKREWAGLFLEVKRVMKKNGKLIIAYRASNSIYNWFYNSVKRKMGDDITKTVIYSFFGPYKPLSNVGKELKMFRVKGKSFFLIPPVFEEYAELVSAYKNSGGTTFLHRTGSRSVLSKVIAGLAGVLNYLPIFGSLKVLVCEKQ